MTYHDFWQSLTAAYDDVEAKAVARMVLDVAFGLSMADVLCGKDALLGAEEQARWRRIGQRLLAGEPVQYVLGEADFGPRRFRVSPAVLIPRPETYELCQWVLEDAVQTGSSGSPNPDGEQPASAPDILDIGTGSGCIACTLALDWRGARVTGWDISAAALDVARQNARRFGANLTLEQRDMLQQPYDEFARWDVIVSNPPYICRSEAARMERHVLDFEPREALFVDDDQPIIFYERIANYAQSALKEGGRLYFEINPNYDEYIEDWLMGLGFDAITTRDDQFGKTRFMSAQWH